MLGEALKLGEASMLLAALLDGCTAHGLAC